MKGINLLIFLSILFIPRAIADSDFLDEGTNKETAINNLIKIENENKALHFGASDLAKFSNAINNINSLNCFEKRCINQEQLKLTITGPPDDASIYVDLGGSNETIEVNPTGNKLKFFEASNGK